MDHIVPHVMKLIYQMIDSGWEPSGLPSQNFVELLAFYANNVIPTLGTEQIESSKSTFLRYSAEIISLFQRTWIDDNGAADLSKHMISRALQEIAVCFVQQHQQESLEAYCSY